MAVTNEQIRAARSLLSWSQTNLATAVGVVVLSVKRVEAGMASEEMRARGVVALEKAGIEFIPQNGGGAGVRLRGKGETFF